MQRSVRYKKTLVLAKSFMLTSLVLLTGSLQAKSYILSSIKPPSQIVISLDPSTCKQGCLKKLFKKGSYYSFVASYQDLLEKDSKNINKDLQNDLFLITSNSLYGLDSLILDINKFELQPFKIAILIPKKVVGRYSITTIDTALAYLLERDIDFEIKVFNSNDENAKNLKHAYEDIRANNFNFVIAVLTNSGLNNLLSVVNMNDFKRSTLYIPTINKLQVTSPTPSNIYFGGINYKEQLEMITKYADTLKTSPSNKIISFNDDSYMGTFLGSTLKQVVKQDVVNISVDTRLVSNFSSKLNTLKKSIPNSSIIFNTSIIKTGLILSQIATSSTPLAYFSTQIGYNPSIMQLTQPEDITNLFVVSSINTPKDNASSSLNSHLVEYSYILNSDLKYDWVNYATSIGVDFFVQIQKSDLERYFSEEMLSNQVIYKNQFYKIQDQRFVPNN